MSVEETKKYEEAREKNRKKSSVVRGSVQNANTNSGRAEQRERSVGEGQSNLGSNRNMGRKHQSEDAPEHKPQGGFGFTKPQFERSHEKAPVASEGSIDNRKTVKSGVTLGRHVQSDPGFKIAERRNAAVVGNRNSTAKTFDEHRKKSSSV